MSRAKRLLATPLGVAILVGLLFVAALSLSGCAEPVAIAAVPPTATVYALPPTEASPPPPAPTRAALDFPLAPPPREQVEVASDQTCVDCHTDQATLVALAVEEEVAEKLSEGEG
jgi:hypothetical protein